MTPQRRLKQIFAILALIIIGGLYITTLILSLIGSESTKPLFTASIICTVVVPVFLYIVFWFYKKFKGDDSEN